MRKKTQTAPPEGFRYQDEILPIEEEQTLIEQIRVLPLKEFEFHGYVGKRRTMSFGWHYDFGDSLLHQTEEMPAFLLRLRESAAAFADLSPEEFPHALVTEYGPGAAIGWHRDKGVFDEVVGISLYADRRAALSLSPARRVTHRLGAQHPGRGCAALFDHLPKSPDQTLTIRFQVYQDP